MSCRNKNHKSRIKYQQKILGKSRKSPSTTNDSGHGSQGHLEDKIEAMAIVEDDDEEAPERMSRGKLRRMRTGGFNSRNLVQIRLF